MKLYLIISLLLLPISVYAGGKKSPGGSISFHIQGSAAEAPKFAREVTTIAGTNFFRIVPEVSNRDALSFSPFPSKEDNSYGVMIQLNKKATRKLELMTTLHQGKLLLSIINGEPNDVVRINKPIKDGVLVIWTGVTLAQIDSYDLVVPRTGEDPTAWKKRVKEVKKKIKLRKRREKAAKKD